VFEITAKCQKDNHGFRTGQMFWQEPDMGIANLETAGQKQVVIHFIAGIGLQCLCL
jgi:hypothetical protein